MAARLSHSGASPAAAEAVRSSTGVAAPRSRSTFSRPWRRFRQTRLATAGLVWSVLIIAIAALANIVAPYDPTAMDSDGILSGTSARHLLGTDELGRDLLSRVIYGGRVSLEVGVASVVVAMVVGISIGIVSGFFGGWLDEALMRVMDAVWAFPSLVLALALAAALGPSVINEALAVGLVAVPTVARLVRAETLSVRERDFVIAARALGGPNTRLLWRHILPNVVGSVVVQGSLMLGFAILTEASLSFLGLGVPPPTPTWGAMLRGAYEFTARAPWMSVPPGLAIFLTVIAMNFVGDGLRAALDPRRRESV